MSAAGAPARISGTAFASLLLVALLYAANHVAARLAFDHGSNVLTAITVRSGCTAVVVWFIVRLRHLKLELQPGQASWLLILGLLVSVQSFGLYSAVARLPVALALLAFNTYPLWTALWARLWLKQRTEPAVLKTMPFILIGLMLSLDVFGQSSGLRPAEQWQSIGAGVLFALMGSASFGLALVVTQYRVVQIDGQIRTATTMGLVSVIVGSVMMSQGGPQWPHDTAGWAGLVGLTVMYGTAFTLMFVVLPKLGVVGNSAIMNVEPIFSLLLAWLLLGQVVGGTQVLGALLVVGSVMFLGLRKR
ncbi:MAG: DMT family transporter [Burkholderiaceae bacterium]